MLKKFKTAIVIGRFQPLHNGHITLISSAFDVAESVVVIIGSVNSPRTPKNPFTFAERSMMIQQSFTDQISRLFIFGVEDTLYSDQQWVSEVQYNVDIVTHDKGVVLIGHHRDASSYYLDMFPQWQFLEVPAFENNLNGTAIRELFYNQTDISRLVPSSVTEVIHNINSVDIATLRNEHQYLNNYKQQWSSVPYPVNFVTTDAVVVQSGHVLMVKRGGYPGKGLWALPGGFLGVNETIETGIIRELREETKLKVPEKVLLGCIKNIEVFDAPSRSERGRTITHAALIVLNAGHDLPRVKGADDAEAARWIPISTLRRMRSEIYEDHYDIIFKMTSSL